MSLPSLNWLQIHRYEQFEPVRIEFSNQENLILGINGAGKTSLLRLIRAVLSLDFGELRDRVFDVEFELSTGTALALDVVRGRVHSDTIERTETVDSEYPNTMPSHTVALCAHLALEARGLKISCELKDGRLVIGDDAGSFTEILPHEGHGPLLDRARWMSRKSASATMREIFPLCESVMVSEADQEFQLLTSEVECSVKRVSPSYRDIAIDPSERLSRLLRRDLYPLLFQVGLELGRDIGSEGMHPAPFMFGRTIFGRSSIDSDLLSRIQAAVGATQLLFVPKIVREKDEFWECRGLGIRVQFIDGTKVVESELTFGQRRFLYAGLMLLSHPGEPMLIDEVDNGLHPRLVETLLQLLAGRQERVSGSEWKSTPGAQRGAQERRRRLVRDVATALKRGRVVFFHVDADEVWERRARCPNVCEHWP